LKDDAVIEVLEIGDIEVVYDFDRLHENQPDKYWATAEEAGFQFGFDAEQVLHVIFLYATPIDGFSEIDREDCDVPFFSGFSEVESYASQKGVRTESGKGSFLGVDREWMRLHFPKYSLHYEYSVGNLRMVTISSR
jgi:hypothetical protein